MEEALNIPEILDHILEHADRTTQAIAARTCQLWSHRALSILWADISSFIPLLKLLSPLVALDGKWHFAADVSHGIKWDRFETYATRVRKLSFNDKDIFQGERALPSSQLLISFLYRPSPNTAILPNLTSIKWDSWDHRSVVFTLIFLSPSVTCLEVNCHGRNVAMEVACAKLLRSLTPRHLKLTEFMLSVTGPGDEYITDLTEFLSCQQGLQRASLPTASATSETVKALGSLPFLREYTGWGDVEYQDPAQVGMKFDWDSGSFESLEELGFYAPSLPHASQIMAKRNGPMLKRLYLSCLSPFEPAELEDLTRTLATFHVNLTLIRLSLFSLLEDPASPDVIEFERVRPLLQCTALSMLLLWHNGPMMYGEEDVAMMGHAWPDMMCLELCLDPTDDVARAVGQPLSIIGVLIRTFPKLEELGVYVNEAGVLPNLLEPKIGLPVPPLRILDFGTSPPARLEESDPKEDIAMYLASVCPPGVGIWNSRSVSHVRNVEITEEQEEEHARRSVYWEDMAEKVNLIHMGMKYMATGISGLVAR